MIKLNPNCPDEKTFIRLRQRYWKTMVKHYHPEIIIQNEEENLLETNFIKMIPISALRYAIFEDEGETGYVYLLDTLEGAIVAHFHVYNASQVDRPKTRDIQMTWNAGQGKISIRLRGQPARSFVIETT
jgi:hypothetical protein